MRKSILNIFNLQGRGLRLIDWEVEEEEIILLVKEREAQLS